MVCGGGGGAPAVAVEGVVKGLCARMQAHADVRQCAMLASRRGACAEGLELWERASRLLRLTAVCSSAATPSMDPMSGEDRLSLKVRIHVRIKEHLSCKDRDAQLHPLCREGQILWAQEMMMDGHLQ